MSGGSEPPTIHTTPPHFLAYKCGSVYADTRLQGDTTVSKSIRIKQHLYDEIQALAESENRPLIRQLEMLLEQALGLRANPIVTDTPEVVLGAALPHKMDHSRQPKAPPPPVVREAPERDYSDFVAKKMKG